MDLGDIQEKIENGRFRLSLHAELEAETDNLNIAQIVEAILNGKILEQYDDTGRGHSCLIVGFTDEVPIHIVCGMRDDNVIIVTVYEPGPPKFLDPWTRG